MPQNNTPPVRAAGYPARRRVISPRCATALLILGLLLAPMVASEQSEVSPQQLEQLDKRIKEVTRWLASARTDRSGLVKAVEELEQKVSQINRRLHQLGEEQQVLHKTLAQLDREAQALRDRLKQQRRSLEAQLVSAWKQGEAPGLKVLLNETDPQQLSRQMTYHEYLSGDAVKRLDTFRQTLTALQANREEAIEARAELTEAQKTAEAQRHELEQRQGERRQALAALNKEIGLRQGELKQLQADRERLEALLQRVREAVRDLDLPDQSTPFAKLAGKLPRPVPGKVLARYGEPMAGGKLRRNGIVMEVDNGAAVRAVHYGRVVFSDWLRGFGLLVILDHGDGYMSLYGQNDGLLKNVGDWVSAGEVIALGGKGGGNPPGLYFEIRKKGKPIDPGKWLSKL